MMESMTITFIAKMLLAIMALAAIRLSLLTFDKAIKVDFKKWINMMEEEHPQDLATYYGYRFIGICILFAYILG